MEMPNSLGNFAWGCRIPCLVGDTKNTEGVPKSLGELTRGCQILGGAGSPMTPDHFGGALGRGTRLIPAGCRFRRCLQSTVNALINAPLKNNYDPQRRLVWSYFGPLGAPYLERRLRIRAQLTPFREVERAEYGCTDNDQI